MSEPPISPEVEQLIREYEALVCKERGSAIHMTFWGGMILDPHKVWVTEEQAARSMKELERLV